MGRRGRSCGGFRRGTERARPEGIDAEEEARSRARLSTRNGGGALGSTVCEEARGHRGWGPLGRERGGDSPPDGGSLMGLGWAVWPSRALGFAIFYFL
jgi:hypothetical protein